MFLFCFDLLTRFLLGRLSAGAFVSAVAFDCWGVFYSAGAFCFAGALFCCHVLICGCYHKLHDGRKLVFVVL